MYHYEIEVLKEPFDGSRETKPKWVCAERTEFTALGKAHEATLRHWGFKSHYDTTGHATARLVRVTPHGYRQPVRLYSWNEGGWRDLVSRP
jgi:hypothetical protein